LQKIKGQKVNGKGVESLRDDFHISDKRLTVLSSIQKLYRRASVSISAYQSASVSIRRPSEYNQCTSAIHQQTSSGQQGTAAMLA
jgi:hypothetical protein